MNTIIISTIIIGLVGLILGAALVTASKKFYVETDDRVTKVRECLRGANCGACGYAGCDAVAEAIVKGEARVDACPGNSTENIAKIAAILGKETVDQDPQVAYVQCAGTCGVTKPKAEYVGIPDCRAAVLSGLNFGSCEYGCLGLGSPCSHCFTQMPQPIQPAVQTFLTRAPLFLLEQRTATLVVRSCIPMMPLGQVLAHRPQPTHIRGLTTAMPSRMEMAPWGHTLTQLPRPRQPYSILR